MALAGPMGEATRRVERRFLTASLVPMTLFVGAFVAAWMLVDRTPEEIAGSWRESDLADKAAAVAVFLSVSWFLASLLASNWRKIVRLYEGYPILRLAGTRAEDKIWWSQFPGVAWHMARCRELPPNARYRRCPPSVYPDRFLPTTVGNTLLSAELYALDRYGLDVNLLWPRLYWFLPDDVRSSIDV